MSQYATLTLKLNLVAGSLKYKIRNIGVSNSIGDRLFLSLIFKVLFISCFKWFSYNAYNDVLNPAASPGEQQW